MGTNRQRYILWLELEDGTKTELAQAYGSNFWTDMFNLAKATYGEKKISYTYGPAPEPVEAVSPYSIQARI
jgi:hypothetical protein